MSDAIEAEQAAIAKRLRLRGKPPPVARVSRKALVTAGAVAALALAGALAWSLGDHRKPAPEPALQPAAPPPQTLAALPKDYLTRGQIPKLGPPLPGDLGRPILAAKAARGERLDGAAVEPAADRQIDGGTGSSALGSPPATSDPGEAARRAALDAARTSGLFTRVTARGAEPDDPSTAAAFTPLARREDPRLVSPERLQAPASPYLLQAGTVIPAVLVTALSSEAPGLAIAQVGADVFDSLGGGHRLVPAGARLIGDYETGLSAGRARLSIAWTRLILPDGRSIVLDKPPAVDAQGRSGLAGQVDRHARQVLGAAALSTLLAIGAQAGQGGEGEVVRALRRGLGETVADVGRQAVGAGLAIAPVITVKAGTPVGALLSRDLVLEPSDREVAP